jgi:hypothetical protein
MALQHLRSATANKRPTPGAMSDGQLAMNTNTGSPGLFLKDSNGDLIKIGPIHVGTTAPNVTPAAGGEAGNSKGEQWLDTSSSRYVFKIWDGAAWRSEDGEFVNASGDTMTGALVMDNQQQVRFRETTANGTNFIALQAPSAVAADRTLTLPDVTGTIVSTGDTGSVTSTMILDETILNADINASAAIAGTKISPDFGSQTITTTGVISPALGTAAAPSIAFTGDLNTGIYSPGADQVAIVTNGQQGLTVGADGSVSVTRGGLTLNATGGEGGQLTLSNPTNTGNVYNFDVLSATEARLFTLNNSTNLTIGQLAGTGGIINFATGGAERMRIASNGDVGIGTSSPSVALDVVGTSNVTVSSLAQYFGINATGTAGGVANGLFAPAGNTLGFVTNATERARIDSGGRLLVGTSSAVPVGGYGAEDIQSYFQSGGAAASIAVISTGNNANASVLHLSKSRGGTSTVVNNNDSIGSIHFSGADGTDLLSIAAIIKCEVDGTPGANDMPGRLTFSTTADGNASPTERMRIASNGKVGIGTSSPAYRLDVQGGSQRILNQGTNSFLEIGNGTTTNQSAFIDLVGDTTYTDYGLRIIRGADGANSNSLIENRGTGSLVLSTADAGSISFYTNGINRAVIGSDGIVQITSPSTSQAFTVNATNAAFAAAVFVPTTTRAAGTNCLYIYGVANNILTFAVYNNGNVVNANNSYGAISDIKLKENIVDASSQWDDIKALQVRKYNFKEETGHQTHTQIGLVAQEAELISPGLVTEAFDRDEEGNELETTTKSINYSVLYMKAVKALQEAMERIEALEARIAALEA